MNKLISFILVIVMVTSVCLSAPITAYTDTGGIYTYSSTTALVKVEHYMEGIDGIYTLDQTEVFSSLVGTVVMADDYAKTYYGFSLNPNLSQQVYVTAGNSSTLKIYYSRNIYTLTYDFNGATVVEIPTVQQVKFGQTIYLPVTGFSYGTRQFLGWFTQDNIEITYFTMEAEDITLVAHWSEQLAPTISAIQVKSIPTKTKYTKGEELDLTGLVVEKVYSDGTCEVISDYTISGYDASVVGTQTVTITYEEKIATFKVMVEEASSTIVANGTCGDNLIWELDNQGTLTIRGNGKLSSNDEYNCFKNHEADVYSLVLDSGITGITGLYFSILSNMKALYLPDTFSFSDNSLTMENTLGNCKTLTDVFVDENNIELCSVDGVLYSKDLTKLLRVPRGKNIIRDVPTSVVEIGEKASYRCDNIVSVYYLGREEQWNEIIIGNNNESLTQATMHYSRETISYIVTYNANGGDGEPESQIKHHGEGITLSYVVPTREGYTFMGWATTSDATEAEYSCGATFEVDADTTLYAVWAVNSGDSGENNNIVASGECGVNLTWTFDDDGILIIDGIGDMYDYWSSTLTSPWYSYRSSITSVEMGVGITHIGENAFFDHDSLTDITISDSVTSIGKNAFEDCDSLISIIIPNSVKSIDFQAFLECDSLTSATIGESVISIGDCAFYDCHNLTSIIIPDSVTSIGRYAFGCCTSLTSATIGKSVTSIGVGAFEYCKSLTSATIGKSVTSIGVGAFEYCKSLTSVTIPDSVTSIGNYAFYDCTSLTSVTIGESVTSIGERAFHHCTGLTHINWNAKNVADFSPSNYIFYNAGQSGEGINVVFGDGVEKIPAYAFSNCKSLTSVIIPDSVTSIGEGAFNHCTGLTDVYYEGDETEWEEISISSYNTPLTNATIHYDYAPPTSGDDYEYNTDLKYFVERYDDLMSGYSLYEETEDTDLSYRNHTAQFSDCWEGKLVFVKCKDLPGGEVGYNLLKVYPLKEYAGNVENATENTITLNGKTYNIGRNLTYVDPEDTLLIPEYNPDYYKGKYVCIRICNSEVVSISIPQWDKSDGKILRAIDESDNVVSISKGYHTAEKYYLSQAAKIGFSDAEKILNSNIHFLYDEFKSIYDIIEYTPVETSFYETYKPSTWEEVENAYNEFISAGETYNNGIIELLNKRETEEEKKAKARRNGAIQLMEKDKSPDSNFLTFSAGTPDSDKIYAYEALYDALERAYDGTGVDLGDIKISGDTISSTTAIVNKLIAGFGNSTSFTQKYDDYTVSVTMNSYGVGTASYFGKMTLRGKNGNTIDGNIIICSNTEDIKKTYAVYFSQLNELAKNSVDAACDAVLKELTGKSIKDWGKFWLKNSLKKYAPELLSKGAGNVFNTVNTTYKTYKKAKDILELKDASPEKKIDKALSIYNSLLGEYYSDKSISDKMVDSLYSALSNKFDLLMGDLYSYASNTEVTKEKKDGWWTSIKCPTNVYVYDNAQNLVGYIEGNEVKHNDEIILEKIGNVKKVYLPDISNYEIKVVATDKGQLNYTVEQYIDKAPVGRINYYDIELYEGKEIISSSKATTIEDHENIQLQSDGMGFVGEYISSSDNARVVIWGSCEGNGYILGLGSYVKGDGVVLNAIPDEGYNFEGWYINEELISTSANYSFCAKSEMTVTAKFSENAIIPGINFDKNNNKILITSEEEFNEVELIAAVYLDGKLLNVKSTSVNVVVGDNCFDSPIADYEGGDIIKVMVWGVQSKIEPLFDVCVVNLK